PDAKKRVGAESVTVPAGTFTADHYRDKGAGGETVDFWVRKDLAPFGLVKLTSVSASRGPTSPAVSLNMELVERGKGAKAAIQKPPKPFDAQMIMKRMQALGAGGDVGNGSAAGGSAGGAPASRTPAPAAPVGSPPKPPAA